MHDKGGMFDDPDWAGVFDGLPVCPAWHQYTQYQDAKQKEKDKEKERQAVGKKKSTDRENFPKVIPFGYGDAGATPWNMMPLLVQEVELTNPELVNHSLGPQTVNQKCLLLGQSLKFQCIHVDQPGSPQKHNFVPGSPSPHFQLGDKLAGGYREECENMDELCEKLKGRVKGHKENEDSPYAIDSFAKLMTAAERSESMAVFRWIWCAAVPVPAMLDWTVLGVQMHADTHFKDVNGQAHHPGWANLRQLCGLTAMAIIPEQEKSKRDKKKEKKEAMKERKEGVKDENEVEVQNGRKIIMFPAATDLLYEGDLMLFPLVFADEKEEFADFNYAAISQLKKTLNSYELFKSKGGMPSSERTACPTCRTVD
eukprot:gnl/TRDRNA2_/TRDRNA2_162904_c0_seq2.p1 gnl/TRDRNA2_/TRDRNA2_162904_c0~~gnl/TRDRNA2_/TRDRNA2_162904_c0_seq2.p1  ORF type:complete len:368 (+),score=72.52 gnl/TRDRNA2_/TRDRNA2_162904_c0_seq2:249-1352(+)